MQYKKEYLVRTVRASDKSSICLRSKVSEKLPWQRLAKLKAGGGEQFEHLNLIPISVYLISDHERKFEPLPVAYKL